MNGYPEEILARPFGAVSRGWLIDEYFKQYSDVTPEDAWKHVYRLLLWIDRTIALAHCYESDKAQPGRHWYSRSLIFHKWLSQQFACNPKELHKNIDILFKEGTKLLALSTAEENERRKTHALKQRDAFTNDDMPLPGTDPELEEQVENILIEHFGKSLTKETIREVIIVIKNTLSLENKRKNLVGEGFEDVLQSILRRIIALDDWSIYCRHALSKLPGFRIPPKREKERIVDLALIKKKTNKRILASVKWSLRADREEQFGVDYESYTRNEESGDQFDFVFITNEFDAARLVSACDRRQAAQFLFSNIIHVNPEAIQVVHPNPTTSSVVKLHQHLSTKRIIGLTNWIQQLI